MPANAGEIKGYLTLDTSRFDSAMSKASGNASRAIGGISDESSKISKEFDKAASASESASKRTQTAWKTVGEKLSNTGKSMTTFLTLPIAAAGTAAVKTAGQFDKSMAGVRAITNTTGKDFERLRGLAIDLGGSTAYSATEVADAMTEMGKAGWSSQQIFDGMSGVLDAAAASGEDLGSVSTIVADAISGFGLQAKDATHVADLLAQAANAGTVDIKDLGESFQYVAPVAHSMGFSIEDCSTALLAMSNAGIKGSNAGTALRTMMLNLANPTSEAAEWIERLNIEVVNSDGTFKSFDEIVNMMQKSFKGLTDEEKAAAAEAIAGKTGVAGLLSVVGLAPEEYAKMTKAMQEADGVAKKTAETMQDNLMSKLEQLGGALESLAIKLGDVLLPPLKTLIEWVTNAVDAFSNLPQPIQRVILVAAGITAIVGPIVLGIGKLITAVSAISTALSAFPALAGGFSAALAAITSPVGLVVAAIAGVALVIKNLWDTNEGFRNAVVSIWNAIAGVFSTVFKTISDLFNLWWNSIATFFSDVLNKWVELVQFTWDAIKTAISLAFQAIAEIINIGFTLITLPFRFIWENCKEVVIAAWEAIKGAVSNALNAISDTIQSVWNAVYNFFNSILNNIKSVVSSAWDFISSLTSSVWNNISTTVSSVWESIKSTVGQKVSEVRNNVSSAWNDIRNITSDVFNDLRNVASSAFDNIVSVIDNAISSAKNIVRSGLDAIQSFFGSLHLELPHIKLPHFRISGTFSLDPPQIPSITVDWYRKAMNRPAILSKPTIFGMSKSGRLLGGGEAGNEVIAGERKLMEMIENIVSSVVKNNKVNESSSGDIVIPIYIGQELIDTVVARANDKSTYRSGGRG